MKPNVTICIPTYKSESFIHRTLDCARAQTHEAIRIVVSVDPSDDNTVEVCKEHASEDSRIELLIQKERLGWSQNANAVLDCVDTEFFFLYFHDDIIEPAYVETLLRALAEQPDAVSTHCDLVEFGLGEAVRPAHSYTGSAFRRVVDFMMTQRGTTLRSMIRNHARSNEIRFPKIHCDNHWAAYVFHMKLLLAGPAVAVHKPYYRRWQREGSLTRSRGWQPENLNSMLRGQREAAQLCLKIVEQAATTVDEHIIGRYCLQIFQLIFARQHQLHLREFRDIEGSDISESLGSEKLVLVPGVLDPEAEDWVLCAEKKLQLLNLEVAKARQ